MNLYEMRNELNLGKSIYDLNLRVVFYARVSTDNDEQLHSLDNQKKFFFEHINNNKNWNYIGCYIDEGISGTSTKNRDSFLKMIEDAKAGQFDLILTKEISRFSRNTIDSLNYTSKLYEYGVAVYFLYDNINTINADSELRLTIMSSIAQEEVRKLSERIKFGFQRSIKEGRVLGGGNIIGYLKKDGKLLIDEEKRKMIETIYSMYATGKYGFGSIALKLEKMGHLNSKGKLYDGTVLSRILTNPKYKGFYCGKKSYIKDYKTHKKSYYKKEDWILYEDSKMPAIVTSDLWNKANEIYDKRHQTFQKKLTNKNLISSTYPYTSKLICKEHNTSFVRCGSGSRINNPVWCCNNYVRKGNKACNSIKLQEKDLNIIFINIINKYCLDKKLLKEEMINKYQNIVEIEDFNHKINILKERVRKINLIKNKLLEILTDNLIDKAEFYEKNETLNKDKQVISNEIKKIKKKCNNNICLDTKIHEIEKNIHKNLNIKNNLKTFINIFIDKVIVDNKLNKIEIILKNGKVVKRKIEI